MEDSGRLQVLAMTGERLSPTRGRPRAPACPPPGGNAQERVAMDGGNSAFRFVRNCAAVLPFSFSPAGSGHLGASVWCPRTL